MVGRQLRLTARGRSKMMARREIERFEAVGDNGARYIVVLMAELTEFQPLRGPVTQHTGATAYELLDGRHVNQQNSMTFQIFDTDEIIRKVG